MTVMTKRDTSLVVAEVDRLRADLGASASFREPGFLAALADRLMASPVLSSEPIVAAFVEDIRGFEAEPRLARTKKMINSGEGTIFSLFDASYFPSLSLDWLSYRELPADTHLAARYPSPTRPVVIERMSAGFASRVVVALFPENHIDGVQEPTDSIFYFIDKFVERHVRLTRRLVDAVMAEGTFALVRAASVTDVQTASSWWVRLHEYHHRQGHMPIPEYLPVKSLKPLAGLEELRTDVSSMLACLHDPGLPAREAELTFEYILAERLLRYAVEGIPRPNYDAIASQLFFNYLRQAGAVVLRGDRIEFNDGLPEALARFLADVEAIEAHIETEPAQRVKARLLEFTNRYTDFDEERRDYAHISFFAEVKQRLGV